VVAGGTIGAAAAALPAPPVTLVPPALPVHTGVVSTASSTASGGVSTAGAAAAVPGASAPAGAPSSMLVFLTDNELHAYYDDFVTAGYASLRSLPSTEQEVLALPPMYIMRPPERNRLVRLLTRRQHLSPYYYYAGVASVGPAAVSSLSVAGGAAAVTHSFPSPVPACNAAVLPARTLPSGQSQSVAVPARLPSDPTASLPPNSPITPLSYDDDSSADDTTDFPAVLSSTTHLAPASVSTGAASPAVDPTCCRAPNVLPTDRRGPDDEDAVSIADSASAPHKQIRSASAPSAVTDGASVSGSGTGATCASDLFWLTQRERELIARIHERTDLMGGLGRMAAGGRQTCHGTVQ
jgi:hypothetical protein